MEQKVIIVSKLNVPPQYEVNEEIRGLGRHWRVISASTSLATHGTMDYQDETTLLLGIAHHVYYVTTVVLERS